MNYRKRHLVYLLIGMADAILIVLSYIAASKIYVGSITALELQQAFGGYRGHSVGLTIITIYSICLVAAYASLKVYGCIYLGRIREMAKRIFVVNMFGTFAFIAFLFLIHFNDASRMTIAIFFAVSTVVVIFANWICIQIFYRFRKSGRGVRQVLVVGNGNLAQQYAEAVGTRASRLEHVIGYLTPGKVLPVSPYLRDCLGNVDEIEDVCAVHHVDEIVIALNSKEYASARTAMAAADKFGTMLTLVPFYNDIWPRRPDIDTVGNINLVNMRSMPLSNPWLAALKRGLDILVSLVVIILTSWLMLITAIGVKLSSPGPILFKQTRIGRNNKPFQMLKFRSMGVVEGDVSTFNEDKDARKTKFGAFIRKFSIDELPQFFNVVAGSMSIVGPRPLVEEETTVYMKNIQSYMLRHQVRPGITGWAQVNGYRGGTDSENVQKRTEFDLYYIENWSLGLDVKIFFMTLFGGFINDEKLK